MNVPLLNPTHQELLSDIKFLLKDIKLEIVKLRKLKERK